MESESSKQVKAEMVITLFDDDSISLTGPVSNRVIAYGMLEAAHDAIFEKSLVTNAKANGGGVRSFLNGLRNKRK